MVVSILFIPYYYTIQHKYYHEMLVYVCLLSSGLDEHYLVRIKSHQTLKGQDIGIKHYDYHLLNQHRIVPSSFSESIKIMSLKYRTDLLLKGMLVSFQCFDKSRSVMSPCCLDWPVHILISINYSAQGNEPSTLIGGQKTAQSEREQTE